MSTDARTQFGETGRKPLGSDNEWSVKYAGCKDFAPHAAPECAAGSDADHGTSSAPCPSIRTCVTCGNPLTQRWQKRCCSRACSARQTPIRSQAGEANGNFKGWRSKDRSRYTRQFRQQNPEKVAAHHSVRWALRTGKLVRPTLCDSCLRVCRPDAHHPDYSKRLSVEWLCKRCHRAADLAAVRLRVQRAG
jgi:hypothetical protein